MNTHLTASTLEAKIARRSRGRLAAIVAALVTAGVASALLLTRSGATSVPVHTEAPAVVVPAASIPATLPVNTGSIGNQGVAIPRRLDARYFGEPIGPDPQAKAPTVGSSGHDDGESTGTSLQGECLVRQPRC
jgi:hypothetical protein